MINYLIKWTDASKLLPSSFKSFLIGHWKANHNMILVYKNVKPDKQTWLWRFPHNLKTNTLCNAIASRPIFINSSQNEFNNIVIAFIQGSHYMDWSGLV